MKRKSVTLWLIILIAGAISSGVLLAQKAGPPEPPPPPGAVIAKDHVRRMIYFHGGEDAWLGVTVADVTSEKAKELKLPGDYGAIVQEVREDSPAAKAGIAKGDVILNFAGEKVRSVAVLQRLVRETPPGRTVSMEISRSGRTRTIPAEIAKAPDEDWTSHFEMPEIRIPDVHVPNFDFNMMFGGPPRLGISADELTPQLADYFGVKEGKGVLVREVEKGTPAEKAGLKAGDVIVKVNDTDVASVGALRRALHEDSGNKNQVTLTIVRNRKEQTLNVQLEPARELTGPESVAELRNLGVTPEEMMQLKKQVRMKVDEALAQAKEIQKNYQLTRLQREKIRREVDRAMQEQWKAMEHMKLDLEKLRLEQLPLPI
jgi:serine protease Do